MFEYVNSGSLLDYLQIYQKRETTIPENEVKQLFAAILQGVAHIHRNHFMHRDLKLENILL